MQRPGAEPLNGLPRMAQAGTRASFQIPLPDSFCCDPQPAWVGRQVRAVCQSLSEDLMSL